jgi:hypothetical protein
MSRPLALSVAGGGLASVFLRAVELFGEHQGSLPFPLPECPICPEWLEQEGLHPPSLALGIAVGLAAGPLLDLVILLRAWWGQQIRRAWARQAGAQPPLFRLL